MSMAGHCLAAIPTFAAIAGLAACARPGDAEALRKAPTPEINYRVLGDFEYRERPSWDAKVVGPSVKAEETVVGVDQGNWWIRVGGAYLPLFTDEQRMTPLLAPQPPDHARFREWLTNMTRNAGAVLAGASEMKRLGQEAIAENHKYYDEGFLQWKRKADAIKEAHAAFEHTVQQNDLYLIDNIMHHLGARRLDLFARSFPDKADRVYKEASPAASLPGPWDCSGLDKAEEVTNSLHLQCALDRGTQNVTPQEQADPRFQEEPPCIYVPEDVCQNDKKERCVWLGAVCLDRGLLAEELGMEDPEVENSENFLKWMHLQANSPDLERANARLERARINGASAPPAEPT